MAQDRLSRRGGPCSRQRGTAGDGRSAGAGRAQQSWGSRLTQGRAGSPEWHGGSATPGVAKTSSVLTEGPEQGVTPKVTWGGRQVGEVGSAWSTGKRRNTEAHLRPGGERGRGRLVRVWLGSPFTPDSHTIVWSSAVPHYKKRKLKKAKPPVILSGIAGGDSPGG